MNAPSLRACASRPASSQPGEAMQSSSMNATSGARAARQPVLRATAGPSGPETEELLTTHPLAQAGVLRHVRLEPGTGTPGANRNAALRLATAPTIVFTDDDCRPPEQWLETVHASVERNPGAIIQGRVEGDPIEVAM